MSTLQDLIDVVARLRAPDGCPWDREQTPATVRSYVLEEAHEVVQALDEGDDDALAEELGDLLFNVVLLAQMAAERGAFTMDDVTASITSKMIRRHPHVFAGEDAGVVLYDYEYPVFRVRRRASLCRFTYNSLLVNQELMDS